VQQLHFDRTIVWDDDIEHRIFFIRPTIGVAGFLHPKNHFY